MNTANELPLETLSESGKAPVSRVTDASKVVDIADQMERAYMDGQGRVNAEVKGCLDGNPPITPAKLDEIGQSWRSNSNFRLLESDSSFAQVPYYSIFSEVPHYCTVKLDPTWMTPWKRQEYELSFSEEHYQLMQEWKGFDFQMQLSIKYRVEYGFGPIYFPDKEDPRFRAARTNEVFLPQDSSLNSEEWEVVSIVREEPVSSLFQILENPLASEAGWTPKVGHNAIRTTCNKHYTQSYDWEEWQRRIRHNDLYFGVTVPKVRMANVFIREFTGKISHFIVVRSGQSEATEFLFQSRDRFDNWDQVLHIMNSEIADGYVGGVKGICVKAFNFRDTQNRLKNAIVDAAFVGAQVLLMPTTPEAEEALDIVPMGPYARMPHGVTFGQNPVGSTLDKPLMVDRQMESDLARNLGAYRQNLTDSRGQAVTATEAEINHGVQQTISGQNHNQFVSQLDGLYQEQLRRLCVPLRTESSAVPYSEWERMIFKFQQRLYSRGVPAEALGKVISVRSFRTLGQGSKFFRNQIHEKILSVFPMLPENVRERHLRNYISGIASRDYLESIWPTVELESRADDHLSKAVDEHAVAMVGLQPLWTPTQDSVAHLKAHIPFLMGQFQSIAQGGDPVKVLALWSILGPHIQETLGHIQSSVGIPTPYKMFNDIRNSEFKAFWNQFKMLEGYAKQLQQQTDEAINAQAGQQAQAMANQQAAAGGPPMDIDTQIKLQQTQADIQMAQQKAANDMQIKAAKAQQNLAITDAKAAAKIRNQG